jgi:hypothetical protein
MSEQINLMYLHLFHGRKSPDEQMAGWGFDGPVLRIHGFHVTYGETIHVGLDAVVGKYGLDIDWTDLEVVEGCLYYDGSYYGDWSVFTPGVDAPLAEQSEPVDREKAQRPAEPDDNTNPTHARAE